jgi:hypothetical protein
MNKEPFKNFDLPRQHLDARGNYIPSKARDEHEIARRRALPSGTLIAEQQAMGIKIAGEILSQVEVGQDMLFTTRMLGMAALNTSWYVYGKSAPDVMRRRLDLPLLADKDTDWRQDAAGLRAETQQKLEVAYDLADVVADDHAENRVRKYRIRAFGRHIGNVSLHLAVLRDGQTTIGGNAHEVQKEVRDSALELLESARATGIDTAREHPSMAQLADPDSTLGVYWRNEAPNGAYAVYKDVMDRY